MGAGSVLIDAGHGRFKNSDGSWSYQRDDWWGVIEDLSVQDIAASLVPLLEDELDVFITRPLPKTLHGQTPGRSGEPRWKEAAVYYLRDELAGTADLSSVCETGSRDRTKDVNCRPLYANLLGVDALVSIHENATDGNAEKARGVEVWPKYGDPESIRLARLIHDELTKDPRFLRRGVKGVQKDGKTPSPATDWCSQHAKNLALLRLAQMPAVIVEFLFFTNKEDNALLKIPEVQTFAAQAIARALKAW